jgi:hypothetical protein
VRLYHPEYERKLDRVTMIAFEPAELDGRKVATADVTDRRQIESLLRRGFRPWPAQELEGAPAAPSGTRVPAPAPEAATGRSGAPEAQLPPAAEVDAMTVAELRDLASRHGIEVPAKARKAELRALIRTPF